jgi:transketolase
MLKLGDECGRYLADRAETRTEICVLDADLADSDGADRFASLYPTRFIQAGIAEQCMVSVASGMAACGSRPWVFSFASFLCYRAYDQIRVSVGQTHLPVVLVGSHSGGCGGRNGKTHLALNDIAIISSLGTIAVWSPASRSDIHFAVDALLDESGPAYIRLPRTPLPDLPGEPCLVRWIGSPTSTAIVTHGLATHWAIEVQSLLARSGIQVGIMQILKLWPLDDLIASGLVTTLEEAIIIEDHSKLGGLGSLLLYAGFTGRLHQFGWPPAWAGQSGSDEDLRRLGHLSSTDVADSIQAIVGKRS